MVIIVKITVYLCLTNYVCVVMFNYDDVLPLNSMINIRSLAIIIKSVLHKDNNFYPQIYLNYCSYEIDIA